MADGSVIRLDDHSAELIKLLGDKARIAFKLIGVQAEAHAKANLRDTLLAGVDVTAYGEANTSRVKTGRLRNSITHTVANADTFTATYKDSSGAQYQQTVGATGSEPAVYIGTNVSYAVYHEFGSGVYAELPGGRRGWWVYVDGQTSGGHSGGKTYATKEAAMKAVRYLRSKGLDAHATNGIYPIHFLRNAVEMHMDEYKQIIQDVFDQLNSEKP